MFMTDGEFIRRLLITVGIGIVILILWKLSDILMLAFGAVLVAVILHTFADFLNNHLRVPERGSLALASLIVFGLLGALMFFFGSYMRSQFSSIAERLPEAIDSMTARLGLGDIAGQLTNKLDLQEGGNLVVRVVGIGGNIVNALTDFLLLVIAGLYIAASPRTYRVGLVKLFPTHQHRRVEESLNAAGESLKLWLVSQLIAMVCIGILSTTAFWFIGLPSPIALGLIAGLLEFIPFLGPILGALPAVLIAFSVDFQTALWTILASFAIQQIEGNLIFPIIERHVVAVPPALALFAIVAGGVLFGIPGLIFGFPLAVVIFALVKKLYVRETLGEETPVPGEEAA